MISYAKMLVFLILFLQVNKLPAGVTITSFGLQIFLMSTQSMLKII